MNKMIKVVPRGIRYLSEWEDFRLPELPTIIDKQVTGCGFTEYCISCPQNIILCSPRLILLENKEAQHQGELMYVRNDLEAVLSVDMDDKKSDVCNNQKEIDLEIDEQEKETKLSREEITANYYAQLRESIRFYFLERQSQGLPCKFIVTYDSFRHVREALEYSGVLSEFYVVVDEFQSIFTDARFKSTTEIGFMRQLNGINRVCFVSATPMMDKYLNQLELFKDLDYITLDWAKEDPSRVISPQIIAKPTTGLLKTVSDIIQEYKDGKFVRSSWRDEAGQIKEILSTEVVIYVNSVKNICNIIKRCELTLDNTNILCSRTKDNIKELKKALGLGRQRIDPIGTVPKKGEPHKMFTLCTRTVYLGADFYSTCARTVIVSDSNVDSLAVDITLDLPQIMGRQRLEENPWKNRAELYFRSTLKNMSEEEFQILLEKKDTTTRRLLSAFNDVKTIEDKEALIDLFADSAARDHYRKNYIAVDSKISGNNNLFPVRNELVRLAEIRAFEIQHKDYHTQFTVFNAIDRDGNDRITNETLQEHLDVFKSLTAFPDQMKFICDLSKEGEVWVDYFLKFVPIEFSNYYNVLGPDRCKALKYRNKDLSEEYLRLTNNQSKNEKLSTAIYEKFEIGKPYRKSDIKEMVRDVFDQVGVKETPKASFLESYFNMKPVKITDKITKKRDNGFEILSRKEGI